SKIYRYGSIENGFSLSDGDIDICILNKDDFKYTPAQCVEILGEKLKNNGINDIKLLIRARVPIIKMKDNKSGISCDIGFQNKLAIQNTKLINAYSKIDERFQQMYWSKIKNINEPYMGTLSSYCFILMIIHFLQIRKPPVLPNLQNIYLNNFDKYEFVDNFNVSFFEDIENLHKYWSKDNNESLGKLLVEFFKYYANDFPYISGVASIRTGNIVSKEEKEWTKEHQFETNKTNTIKDRYWFCVEDPFEITHNLGRPVDKKSLFKIRGEFLKAAKIINNKSSLSGSQILDKILEK
ncbi:PAP/OAS1 substrate-binding domain-containing protein, partial [Piromyces finnis]